MLNVKYVVRERELKRRRSRVPWIYLVYHVREQTGLPQDAGQACVAEAAQPRRRGVR